MQTAAVELQIEMQQHKSACVYCVGCVYDDFASCKRCIVAKAHFTEQASSSRSSLLVLCMMDFMLRTHRSFRL